MKRLPCKNGCGDAELPNGKPYILSRAISFPLTYRCARCKKPTKLSAADFSRLPSLSLTDLEDLNELAPILKDYTGAGHNDQQARDLFSSGWTPVELDALPKQGPPNVG